MERRKELLEISGMNFDKFELENEFTAKSILEAMEKYADEKVNDYKCNVMQRGEHIYLKIDIGQRKYEKLISELLQQDGWRVDYSCSLREKPKYVHTKLIRE